MLRLTSLMMLGQRMRVPHADRRMSWQQTYADISELLQTIVDEDAAAAAAEAKRAYDYDWRKS